MEKSRFEALQERVAVRVCSFMKKLPREKSAGSQAVRIPPWFHLQEQRRRRKIGLWGGRILL